MTATACHCCHPGAGVRCPLPATVAVYFGPGLDDYTHACPRHVVELAEVGTLAEPDHPVTLYLILPDGTAGPQIAIL